MDKKSADERGIFVVRVVFEFYPKRGGSVTHVTELCRATNKYLKKQVILAPNFGSICSKYDEESPVPVIRIDYPRKLETLRRFQVPVEVMILGGYSINVAKAIRRFVREEKDFNILVNVHEALLGSMLSLALRLSRTKVPVVVTQHSANPKRVSRRMMIASYLSLSIMGLFKPSRLIILDDGMGLSDFSRTVDKFKINWIAVNHGIDVGFFSACERVVTRRDSNFIVLSTYLLFPNKGVKNTIRSFAEFHGLVMSDKIRLVIVGDGPENDSLRELVRQLKIESMVDFLGQRSIEEVNELLHLSDVVVGSSTELSNLNRSIQEAMACGKPVVAFDSYGTSRLVEHMKNGLLARNGDIQDFASCLALLYRNPDLRIELGRNALKKIADERSWEARMDTELSIYKEALSSGYRN